MPPSVAASLLMATLHPSNGQLSILDPTSCLRRDHYQAHEPIVSSKIRSRRCYVAESIGPNHADQLAIGVAILSGLGAGTRQKSRVGGALLERFSTNYATMTFKSVGRTPTTPLDCGDRAQSRAPPRKLQPRPRLAATPRAPGLAVVISTLFRAFPATRRRKLVQFLQKPAMISALMAILRKRISRRVPDLVNEELVAVCRGALPLV